jgi:hypothetical protein
VSQVSVMYHDDNYRYTDEFLAAPVISRLVGMCPFLRAFISFCPLCGVASTPLCSGYLGS